MKHKFVIFDLDGVLMDSNSLHSKAFITTFSENNLTGFTYSKFAGKRTDAVVTEFLESKNIVPSGDLVTKLVKRKRELAQEFLSTIVPVMPGAVDLLKGLRQKGIKLGLATSSTRENVGYFLKSLGSEVKFDSIVCGPEVPKAKPDPAVFNKSMQELGASPEETVIIEDSESGIRAAHSAKATVGAKTGTLDPQTLNDLAPHFIIENLSEVMEHI